VKFQLHGDAYMKTLIFISDLIFLLIIIIVKTIDHNYKKKV